MSSYCCLSSKNNKKKYSNIANEILAYMVNTSHWFYRLSGRSPFLEIEPQQTEARIQAAKFDLSKLYQNVSQSASLFLKKILCSYPW